jgi:hypothetical protein
LFCITFFNAQARALKNYGELMNIEQEKNMQELKPHEYTKVYGGVDTIGSTFKDYLINPIGPIKPKKPGVDTY